MMTAGKLVLPLLVVLLSGCSVVAPEAARTEIQDRVADRLGASVQINPDRDAGVWLAEVLEDGFLGPDEAIRLAVAHNPRLHAVLEGIEISRAELWQVSLPPNPVADGEIQFLESGGGHILELVAAQSIIDALLIPRRRQVATERFEQVAAQVTAAVIDLATEVRAAYRSLQAQVELVALFRAATDASYFSYDAARRLRDAGNVIELDVLQERAFYEETKVRLTAAQAMARAHRENLNVLLGIWGEDGERWDVEPRLPVPPARTIDAAELEPRAVESSLDLLAMKHAITALGHQSGVRRLEAMFPEATLGGVGEREADGTWSAGPLASFSVPIFDFGQAASAEMRARLRRAYEEFTDLAIRIRRTARSAYVQC